MQKQYKLYTLDKNGIDSTMDKLNIIIGELRYKKINDVTVAVEYDYSKNGYKGLLESMSELDVSQYIVTTSRFYNMLNELINRNLTLYEIKLNSLFEDDNNIISKYIKHINGNNDKKKYLELLLEELKWYNYDEGIDICNMSFVIKDDGDRNFRFHIYNNGVVAIDSDVVENKIFNILGTVV